MKANILSTALANATQEVCTALYDEKGVSAVCDYANKIGLNYGRCDACENDMPAIEFSTQAVCACCGSNIVFKKDKNKKAIKRRYKHVTTHMKMLQITENAIIDSLVKFLNKNIAFYDTEATEIIVHATIFSEFLSDECVYRKLLPCGLYDKAVQQATELAILVEDYDYIQVIDRDIPKK